MSLFMQPGAIKPRRVVRKPQPTWVGFDMPLESFQDLVFSIPQYENLTRGAENAKSYFEWLKDSPRYLPMLQPERFTDPDSLPKGRTGRTLFFPIRHLSEGETYDEKCYRPTLGPTETDSSALLKFKDWIEAHGAQFDPKTVTFRAVPPVDVVKQSWGYYISP